MKNCPKCNAEVADNAKFCFKCGFNIKKHEDESANQKIFCPECGAKIPSGGDFCPECGNNVASLHGNFGSNASGFDGSNGFGGADSFGGFGGFDSGFSNSFASEGGDVFGLGSSDDVALAPFTYEVHTDGTYTITGLKDKTALQYTVPNGVASIFDNAFEGCRAISFTLPEGLLQIGNAAFKNCKNLSSINIPKSLMLVGDEAFMDCVMLDIELPSSVRNVGKDAMKNTLPDVKRQKEAEKKAEEARKAEEKHKAEEEAKRKAELAKWDAGKEPTFGKFNGKPIEWRVLARNGDEALIISKYILAQRAYNGTFVDITWENCTLRKWLNNEFLKSAFNSAEQAKIQNTSVSNPDNSQYNTKGGNTTNDKIFLLSLDEVNRYFSSDSDGICEIVGLNCTHWWYLRSPGANQRCAADVDLNGSVNVGGALVDFTGGGVRPAMWVKI